MTILQLYPSLPPLLPRMFRYLPPLLITLFPLFLHRSNQTHSYPQLQDQATIFIVLSPSFLENGDQAPGQRFLGHYPQGQLRFHDGHLGLKTEAGDYLLKGQVKENQWMIAAYRFEGNVQMSLNGEGFEVVTSER